MRHLRIGQAQFAIARLLMPNRNQRSANMGIRMSYLRSGVHDLYAMVRHLLVSDVLACGARHVAGRAVLLLRMMLVAYFAPV